MLITLLGIEKRFVEAKSATNLRFEVYTAMRSIEARTPEVHRTKDTSIDQGLNTAPRLEYVQDMHTCEECANTIDDKVIKQQELDEKCSNVIAAGKSIDLLGDRIDRLKEHVRKDVHDLKLVKKEVQDLKTMEGKFGDVEESMNATDFRVKLLELIVNNLTKDIEELRTSATMLGQNRERGAHKDPIDEELIRVRQELARLNSVINNELLEKGDDNNTHRSQKQIATTNNTENRNNLEYDKIVIERHISSVLDIIKSPTNAAAEPLFLKDLY